MLGNVFWLYSYLCCLGRSLPGHTAGIGGYYPSGGLGLLLIILTGVWHFLRKTCGIWPFFSKIDQNYTNQYKPRKLLNTSLVCGAFSKIAKLVILIVLLLLGRI